MCAFVFVCTHVQGCMWVFVHVCARVWASIFNSAPSWFLKWGLSLNTELTYGLRLAQLASSRDPLVSALFCPLPQGYDTDADCHTWLYMGAVSEHQVPYLLSHLPSPRSLFFSCIS